VVRGYGWGGILIGGYAVILYFMMSFVHVRVLERSTGDIPESFFPFLQPILSGLYAGAFSEIIFRLFFISYLKERTKKVWTGVVISSMLWTAAGFAMWDRPFGFLSLSWAFVVLFLFGLVFSFLFLRYDLVTAMAANVVLTACSAAVPLFTSEAHTFVVSRWLFIGVMAVPVVVAGIGFIRRERFVFTLETMPRHIQRISERERMAKELEIARSVQMSLLPKMNPSLAGYDIGGICVPAREVGGDYYDFVNLGGRRVGIAVGDVSGKGVPAAIYMTLTKGILQSHAEENVSPKAVLSKVNSLMYRTIERNSFVSMFYAILDLDRKTIRFSRAGQCPVIMTQSAGAPGSFLTPKGMALGLEMGRVFDSVLEELELKLNSGEVLVFYTDGFTEAMNDSNEEFGEERLAASVARHRHLPANEMIRCICDDVNRFAGNRLQHDDMTMVVVKVG
jgi:hypothetical protein